jgi:DNA-binding transcriptional LysR family regulator
MTSKIRNLCRLAAAGLGLAMLGGCVVYDGPRYRQVVVDDGPPPGRVVVVEPAPVVVFGGGYYHGYYGGWHRHWR